MKKYIKPIAFTFGLLTVSFGFMACGSNNEKAIEEQQQEEAHDHDEENFVTLTQEQMKTVGIELGEIEQKQLTGNMRTTGILRVPNNHKAVATSLFGGAIRTLQVEIGDKVNKGQMIATISNPQFIAYQEEYISINSRIELAELELNRQTTLYEGEVGAKKNLQSAQTELSTLKTRKASLQNQIQMMGINPNSLSNSNLKNSLVVTSPISGTVSAVFAKIGSYVDVTSPIIEVVENSALHLDLQVFEKDLPMIEEGQKIDFVLTNIPNKTYEAKVYNIGSSFNDNSKTIAIHSEVIGDKTGLIDGMHVTAMVNLKGELTPALPTDAIVNADAKYYIFMVATDEDHPTDENSLRFEKIEIIKGNTELGYTGFIPHKEIPENAKIVTKGAFFVNAQIENDGDGHEH